MKKTRIIPRLDIKGPNLVKGIQMEGLRKLGDPHIFATRYYEQGADELIYIDIVASLYGRNNLTEIVRRTVKDIFIPITVGGGVRCIDDIRNLLCCGADKVAINTAAIKEPRLIKEAAQIFGSQCIVASIQVKKIKENKWEAYIDNGRERTGIDAFEWALETVELGAGEILVTSVDKEGLKKGYDVEIIRKIADAVPIPVIACGGAGKSEDFITVIQEGHVDAVSAASIFHYGLSSLTDVREALLRAGIPIRRYNKTLSDDISSYH